MNDHICQEVCPWNQPFAQEATEQRYKPRAELDDPGLATLAERLSGMSERAYQREFAGSPLLRPRRRGMLRNLCVGLGNSGSEEAVPVFDRALHDPQPLVRAHAAWALGRLGGASAAGALGDRAEVEDELEVRREIDAALLAFEGA